VTAKEVLDDGIFTIGVSSSKSFPFLELLLQLADMYEIKTSAVEAAKEGAKEPTVHVYLAGHLQNLHDDLSHFRVHFQIPERRAADFVRDVTMADARFGVEYGKVVEGERLDRYHVMVSRDFVV